MFYSTNKHDEIEFSLFLVFSSCCFIYKLYCKNSCVENMIPTLGGKSFATRRSPVRYIKQKPSCEDFFHVCRISQFVQFWISDFGRLQKCSCTNSSIHFCLNLPFIFCRVYNRSRAPETQKRSSLEPDLLLCFVQFLKLKFCTFQILFYICFV